MGRTRKANKVKPVTSPEPASPSTSKATFTPAQLLAKAEDLLAACDFDLCRQFCERALQQDADNVAVLEVLGSAELETGLIEEAQEHFLQVVAKATPADAALASSHLYLAQLADTPQDSVLHFRAALGLLQDRLDAIAPREQQASRPPTSWSSDEADLRAACSRSLIGLTEVYMADLCFEPDASDLCTEYTDLAIALAPVDPDAHATKASVLLSQQRPDDARRALEASYALWRDAEGDDLPPIETRLRCARLLLECELPDEAVEVLRQLADDDDENADVFYLLGLALGIVAEKEHGGEADEMLVDAREALETCLAIRTRSEDEDDQEGMFAHARELLHKLIKSGVPAPQPLHDEDGDGQEDEWEDDDEDDDQMMQP